MLSKNKKTLRLMRESPKNVRFGDLSRVCESYFGAPRQTGGSHKIYRTPWAGDPRINIQEGSNGMAKIYQIRQVLAAIERISKEHGPKE
jgi:hypothetical protein